MGFRRPRKIGGDDALDWLVQVSVFLGKIPGFSDMLLPVKRQGELVILASIFAKSEVHWL